MRPVRRSLLLVGSPRARSKSTSESLGSYLLEELERGGVSSTVVMLKRAVSSPEGMAELLERFTHADLVLLSCPVYVDSLPAPVIRTMEHIHTYRKSRPGSSTLFAAIVQCGFPETRHTEVALAICRRFAKESELDWLGGLGLGGGEAFGGQPMQRTGMLGRNARRALRLAAAALAKGEQIPPEAVNLMAKPLLPPWLYRWIGNRGWRRKARRFGTQDRLMARPYQEG